MSNNWIVGNLENALETWNDKITEIWSLITQSPAEFKGGVIWDVILNIHNALQAIGFALLVLFFVVGVIRTCGNLNEVKRPEQAFKLFVRFALAKAVITYGLDLLLALFRIIQGIVSTIIGDYSYALLIPIAGIMYKYLDKNPGLGIITMFVAISIGYGTGVIYNYQAYHIYLKPLAHH